MAHLSDDRRRQMEDELSRFESEIAASQNLMRQPVMTPGALRFIPHAIHSRPVLMAPQSNLLLMSHQGAPMSGMPPQPPNMSHLLPSMGLGLPQVRRPIKILPLPGSVVNSAANSLEEHQHNVPPPSESQVDTSEHSSNAVIEGAPTVYIRPKTTITATSSGSRAAYSIHSDDKKKKEKGEESGANTTSSSLGGPLQPPAYASLAGSSLQPPSAFSSSSNATGQAPAYSIPGAANNNQPSKPKRYVRAAGGQVWEDTSLAEWDSSDFRLFCGDLGNEVSDELLAKAFRKYPSFQKAKVIRDKRTNKTKGYGFVSFKDPQDFIRAQREMNGKYVGNRPIKLRKSDWQERQLDVVRKKNKEKKKLGLKVR